MTQPIPENFQQYQWMTHLAGEGCLAASSADPSEFFAKLSPLNPPCTLS
jgi:hypothetical protein